MNRCIGPLQVVTLQIIVTLSLLSTLYKSLHAKSSQFDFTGRFLVTDLNNESFPAYVLTSLFSGEYPANELIQRNSKLLYDWRFTASQFVLASSPFRLKTRDLFLFQLSPCGNSPYVTSFLTKI
jgi:hypothetical protein